MRIRILDEDKQTVTRDDSPPIRELNIRDHSKPHWLKFRPQSCHMSARFQIHDSAHWLSIDAREWYESDKGRIIEKRAMVSLEAEAARALYAMLRERFAPQEAATVKANAEALQRVADALGTGETGEGLIAVARDAHTAEQRAAHALRELEDLDAPSSRVIAILRG